MFLQGLLKPGGGRMSPKSRDSPALPLSSAAASVIEGTKARRSARSSHSDAPSPSAGRSPGRGFAGKVVGAHAALLAFAPSGPEAGRGAGPAALETDAEAWQAPRTAPWPAGRPPDPEMELLAEVEGRLPNILQSSRGLPFCH
mmetsp:Transcript_107714/g.304716  ORF Transcript_107714/g.304716 Transcript_107714/m.304716 type:complete len:143 (+) Transcript_107714:65-493(+)